LIDIHLSGAHTIVEQSGAR